MNQWLHGLGQRLALFLNQPLSRYEAFDVVGEAKLATALRPGDVLLVEGDTRIGGVIRYVTQSNWSHSALYVGNALAGDDPHMLVEADVVQGVIASPLSKFARLNTRICRPVGLTDADRDRLIAFVIGEIGHAYDLKNVFDLLRFYAPLPMPVRFRRRMLAFGGGDPTRAICSTMIAQAFQQVRYPILPRHVAGSTEEDCLKFRHYSHFTPSDFDRSPYFAIVKPTLVEGFDYKQLHWATDAPPRSEED
ncbi:MAG TPA: YiiX/YebB-like N1pC/P60 family cysteine hydrolase [Mariprofundaceae bacterium]|nr:YiiX/YebB-like N1pC/P60 family cysteine hydrolase [Mariprofundaceae bacterium]